MASNYGSLAQRWKKGGKGQDGFDKTEKGRTEKHKEGCCFSKKEADNLPFAQIGADCPRQAGLGGRPEKEKKCVLALINHGSASIMTCDIRIGTSGYHYKHWRGPFYAAKIPTNKMLEFYARHFNTVELNNSFYRLPTETAIDDWRTTTPSNFVFALKASRFLTHNKKLKDPQSALEKFVPLISRFETKLGPVLFQLPPNWKVNYERLEALLQLLPKHFRYVFELRDQTWINPEIDALLSRFGAAFCIYELAGYQSPLTVTADFAYVRLHGPGPAKYQGKYDCVCLRQWCHQMELWAKRLAALYVYFDNDQSGFAALNALTLKRMLFGDECHD